jgi:hypothetical protein
VRGVTGFRLESTRRDVFSGTVWASVRSCQHPERPALLVLASAAGAGERAGLQDAAPSSSLIMLAGTSVRVFESSENVRLEMPGVVQASGRLGDRVRVRLVPVTAGGSGDGSATEQFATGIVRSRNVIELETR